MQQGGGIMTSKQRSGTEDVVDMELHCVRCQARLYVPLSQMPAVLASLERTGAVILICVCGQAQLVRSKRQRRHD
jgi:hypothetical protein